WKVADLAGDLGQLGSGRNLARGKELFTGSACVQCHRIDGMGGQIGPDLEQMREKVRQGKMKPLDVLTELIEPSKVIEEKYRTVVLELTSGKVVSGVIVHEDGKEVHVASNPLEHQGKEVKPTLIRKDQIDGRFP